jgi:hypothetical protein
MEQRTRSTTTAAVALLFGTVTFKPVYSPPPTSSRRAGCLRHHRFSPAPAVEDAPEIDYGHIRH